MLKDTEMEFDEIVKNTGKSKSTVSVHLKSLRNDGIVSFKFDKDDQRKKIFYINSKFLGEIEPPEPFELEEQKIDYLLENIINRNSDESDMFEFHRLLFHTFRSSLIQEGINIDPILYDAGHRIGLAIYEKLETGDLDSFVNSFKGFWENHGLGKLEFNFDDKIGIKAYDCFECELLPKTGKPTCYLDAGIIEAAFSSFLKKDVKVTEINCFTMGDDFCSFEVEPSE